MKSLKFISLLLCVALLCVLTVACGDDNPTDSGSKTPADSSNASDSSYNGNSDLTSTETQSNNTQSTASTDNNSSSEGANSQSSSSNVGNTSSEQASTVSTPSTDINALTVYVESKQEGNVVTAEIKIKNNPGLTAFSFEVSYNTEALSPNKITKGLVSVTSNLQQNQNLSGNITLLYVDANGFSENGTLATVTFDVKATGKPFDLHINATQNSFLKLDGTTYVVDFDVK